jgi:hypothetical protein
MASFELDNTPQTVGVDSSWSSAPKLSRKVRELAHRSFHAIHSDPHSNAAAQASSRDVDQALRDLRDEVAWLQHKIHARKLDSLIPWVDSLRRQVDNRRDDAGKAEQ